MLDLLKRIIKGIIRRVDPTPMGRVRRIIKNPPNINKKSIVFTSSPDYSGNPKALFLYMIEHGLNKKYKITWLFEHRENLLLFDIPNVESVVIWDEKGTRLPMAQKAIMSAGYIFYSHNVNWCKKFRDGQTFINLWHGCGYKDTLKSDDRIIYYDYTIVTGKKYVEVFKKHLKNPEGNILDLGYPRNELLKNKNSEARGLIDEIKRNSKANKAIIWMPTYRRSTIDRLNSDTELGSTGLPILYETEHIAEFNEWCMANNIVIILKRHMMQEKYELQNMSFSNIVPIDDEYLHEKAIELYGLLGVSDALLTDYSSVAIDYLLLDKPIGYALDDFDEYQEARGWCLDNVKDYMPGAHIYDIEDLKSFVIEVAESKDPHKEWRHRILPELQTYNDGYSRRILDYFGI